MMKKIRIFAHFALCLFFVINSTVCVLATSSGIAKECLSFSERRQESELKLINFFNKFISDHPSAVDDLKNIFPNFLSAGFTEQENVEKHGIDMLKFMQFLHKNDSGLIKTSGLCNRLDRVFCLRLKEVVSEYKFRSEEQKDRLLSVLTKIYKFKVLESSKGEPAIKIHPFASSIAQTCVTVMLENKKPQTLQQKYAHLKNLFSTLQEKLFAIKKQYPLCEVSDGDIEFCSTSLLSAIIDIRPVDFLFPNQPDGKNTSTTSKPGIFSRFYTWIILPSVILGVLIALYIITVVIFIPWLELCGIIKYAGDTICTDIDVIVRAFGTSIVNITGLGRAGGIMGNMFLLIQQTLDKVPTKDRARVLTAAIACVGFVFTPFGAIGYGAAISIASLSSLGGYYLHLNAPQNKPSVLASYQTPMIALILIYICAEISNRIFRKDPMLAKQFYTHLSNKIKNFKDRKDSKDNEPENDLDNADCLRG